MQLRPYQEEARAAWDTCLAGASPRHPARGIIAHATGLGKTVQAAAWIADLLASDLRQHILFLAHRDELIQQAAERIGQWIDPTCIGIVKAERHEADVPVVIGSVPSVARRLDRLQSPTAVIVDECHHALADTYQRILTWLEPSTPVLGLSATPHRSDGKPFGTTWPSGIVHEITLRQGIERGYLADLRTGTATLSAAWDARVRRGDFVETDLERCFERGRGAEAIAQAIKTQAQGRPTLVFTPTVATAHETARVCKAEGLDAAAIDGTTLPAFRQSTIAAFQNGQLPILVNCAVLTEGFDAPATSCLVIARPTKSRSLYLQMLGRGTRKAPGKDDCLVIDLVDATKRHDLESVETVLGVTLDARESVAEAIQRDPRGFHRPLWQARAYAWVKTAYGYALGLGKPAERPGALVMDYGTLLLREHTMLGVAIYQLRRGQRPAYVDKAPDLESAQNLAEDYVRGLEVDRLVRRDQGWRRDRISQGQRRALEAFKVKATPDWTRGQAADQLTKTITELQWRAGQ